jgi:hypothetical protein
MAMVSLLSSNTTGSSGGGAAVDQVIGVGLIIAGAALTVIGLNGMKVNSTLVPATPALYSCLPPCLC